MYLREKKKYLLSEKTEQGKLRLLSYYVGYTILVKGLSLIHILLLELPNTHIVFRMDACKSDEIGSKPDIAVTGDALQFFLNMEK